MKRWSAIGLTTSHRAFVESNCEPLQGSQAMSALGGGFNRSTQHLLILLEKEVCDGGDCTDMVHAAAEG